MSEREPSSPAQIATPEPPERNPPLTETNKQASDLKEMSQDILGQLRLSMDLAEKIPNIGLPGQEIVDAPTQVENLKVHCQKWQHTLQTLFDQGAIGKTPPGDINHFLSPLIALYFQSVYQLGALTAYLQTPMETAQLSDAFALQMDLDKINDVGFIADLARFQRQSEQSENFPFRIRTALRANGGFWFRLFLKPEFSHRYFVFQLSQAPSAESMLRFMYLVTFNVLYDNTVDMQAVANRTLQDIPVPRASTVQSLPSLRDKKQESLDWWRRQMDGSYHDWVRSHLPNILDEMANEYALFELNPVTVQAYESLLELWPFDTDVPQRTIQLVEQTKKLLDRDHAPTGSITNVRVEKINSVESNLKTHWQTNPSSMTWPTTESFQATMAETFFQSNRKDALKIMSASQSHPNDRLKLDILVRAVLQLPEFRSLGNSEAVTSIIEAASSGHFTEAKDIYFLRLREALMEAGDPQALPLVKSIDITGVADLIDLKRYLRQPPSQARMAISNNPLLNDFTRERLIERSGTLEVFVRLGEEMLFFDDDTAPASLSPEAHKLYSQEMREELLAKEPLLDISWGKGEGEPELETSNQKNRVGLWYFLAHQNETDARQPFAQALNAKSKSLNSSLQLLEDQMAQPNGDVRGFFTSPVWSRFRKAISNSDLFADSLQDAPLLRSYFNDMQSGLVSRTSFFYLWQNLTDLSGPLLRFVVTYEFVHWVLRTRLPILSLQPLYRTGSWLRNIERELMGPLRNVLLGTSMGIQVFSLADQWTRWINDYNYLTLAKEFYFSSGAGRPALYNRESVKQLEMNVNKNYDKVWQDTGEFFILSIGYSIAYQPALHLFSQLRFARLQKEMRPLLDKIGLKSRTTPIQLFEPSVLEAHESALLRQVQHAELSPVMKLQRIREIEEAMQNLRAIVAREKAYWHDLGQQHAYEFHALGLQPGQWNPITLQRAWNRVNDNYESGFLSHYQWQIAKGAFEELKKSIQSVTREFNHPTSLALLREVWRGPDADEVAPHVWRSRQFQTWDADTITKKDLQVLFQTGRSRGGEWQIPRWRSQASRDPEANRAFQTWRDSVETINHTDLPVEGESLIDALVSANERENMLQTLQKILNEGSEKWIRQFAKAGRAQ